MKERIRRWKCLLCKQITEAPEAPSHCPHCGELAAFGDADVLETLRKSSKSKPAL